MMKLTLVLLCLAAVSCTGEKVFDVRDFGAAGDGINIDSPAINSAISAAALSRRGVVLIPEGTYKCFSIRLESNVTLRLDEGSVIKAAMYDEGEGFDDPEENPWSRYQDFGHSHWKNSLIWGIGLENVTICGEGLIDGSLLSDGVAQRLEPTDIDYDFTLVKGAGNKAISLKECRNVKLEGITIKNGGHFCILATGVDNMVINGLTIDSVRDGIDIDCCTNVIVEDCDVNTPWDDAIVLKSSYALGRYQDCEDITIRDCRISGYAVGTLLSGEKLQVTASHPHHKNPSFRSSGRIKLGTESSGGFRHIHATNCSLEYCGGLHVESNDGGVVDDVRFENISIIECSDSPVFIVVGSRMRSPEGKEIGSITNISFENIKSFDARPDYGIMIVGKKESVIRTIKMTDCLFHSKGGMDASLKDRTVPELTGRIYPDPKSFGAMPSKGVFLRYAEDISLDNVQFEFESHDGRPLYVAEEASALSASGITPVF